MERERYAAATRDACNPPDIHRDAPSSYAINIIALNAYRGGEVSITLAAYSPPARSADFRRFSIPLLRFNNLHSPPCERRRRITVEFNRDFHSYSLQRDGAQGIRRALFHARLSSRRNRRETPSVVRITRSADRSVEPMSARSNPFLRSPARPLCIFRALR